MKHNLWYRIVRWLITHSTAGMTYVIEMRNEVADFYERRIDALKSIEHTPVTMVGRFEVIKEQRNEKNDCD